jgi:hypothetical protein
VFLLHDTVDKFYPVCRFCLLPVYPIIHNHELGLRIKSKVLNARNGATRLEIKSPPRKVSNTLASFLADKYISLVSYIYIVLKGVTIYTAGMCIVFFVSKSL